MNVILSKIFLIVYYPTEDNILNQARIQLEDGSFITVDEGQTITQGNLTLKLTSDYISIRNGGGPDNFGNTGLWTTQPIYFREIAVLIPGKSVLLAPFNGARHLGQDLWVLAGPNDYKHAHPYSPVRSWYQKSTTYHMIDGGDTFYCRFMTNGNVYEPVPSLTARQRALTILNLNTELLSNYPLLRRVLDFYTLRLSSLMKNSPLRDWGWWLFPSNYAYRWTSVPIDFVSGWYGGMTDIMSAGEGFSNCHYDHILYFFIKYLLDNDETALAIAANLLRFKIAYGLIDTNLPRNPCWHKGWWRGEKGARRGAVIGLSANKEWDMGLVIGSILLPNDDFIANAMQIRRDSLLQRGNQTVWNGAGGGRAIGHFLENLRFHYKATNDQVFKDRAENFINHVFTITGNGMWFPNSLRIGFTAVWEEALAHVQIARWMFDYGIGLQYESHLKDMVEWMITNGSDYRGGHASSGVYEVAYEISVPDTSFKDFKHPSHQTWWVQLWDVANHWWPGRFAAEASASINTLMTRIGQNWTNVDRGQPPLTASHLQVDNPPDGPAVEKTWPIELHTLLG